MTRLIEALKKAEEAKRKGETPEEIGGFSLEPEDLDTVLDKPLELASSAEISDSGADFSLEPILPDAKESKPQEAEESIFDPAPDERPEPQLAPVPQSAVAGEARTSGRRQSNRIARSPAASFDTTNRNSRLLAILLVTLLLAAAVLAFFYWQLTKESDPYANLPPVAQNRGFLESNPNPAAQDLAAQDESIESIDAGAATNETSLPTQTTIGPVIQPPEGSSQLEADATISAVSALISTQEQQVTETNSASQPSRVFSIAPAQQISGIGNTFASVRSSMQQGEWDAAKTELEALLRTQPTNPLALGYLAQVHAEMGNMALAERTYARILQLDPQDSAAQAGLIKVSGIASSLDYETALRTLADKYPNAAYIPYMLGNHFAGQQRWSEAAGAYRQALSATESLTAIPAEYVYNLAISLEHLRRQGDALAQYRRAVTLISPNGKNNIDIALLNSRIERLETSLGQ